METRSYIKENLWAGDASVDLLINVKVGYH